LAGARETQLWSLDPESDPVCVVQPTGGNPSADREQAIRRLVSAIGETPGSVRVSDTASSRHFGWALDDGIRRFVAIPVRAHDRGYGLIMIVDFTISPALGSPSLPPGLDRAAEVFASSVGASLFHSEVRDAAADAHASLEEAQRRMEAGERDSARYELCRIAARELRRELGTLATDVPRLGDAMPEHLFHEQMGALGERLSRGDALLHELDLLTERPAARLILTSINDIIHQVVAEIEEDADLPTMRISRRLQGDLPALLLDSAQIGDVLTALLRHGVSGTEGREAVIVTRLQKGDVVVEVSFPERAVLGGVLDSLFRPFHGLTEGTGHPLSLADQVVGEHGGQLRARSEEGEGLVYWLSLPLADNQDRRLSSDRRGSRDRRDTLPRDEG
jgi:signal transduction histidine kinase